MKILLAQLNNTVGDIEGNILKACKILDEAYEQNADLVVFSELYLSGYPPEDLVLKKSFVQECRKGLNKLVLYSEEKKLGLIVGLPIYENDNLYNAVAIVDSGKIIGFSKKVNLPNYSVFDEKRVFNSNDNPYIFDFRGIKMGVPICEDIWTNNVCNKLKKQGCEIIISPNGSPFDKYKINQRKKVIEDRISEVRLPFVYVNQVGGQDELVFDGSSLIMNADKEIIYRSPQWEEDRAIIEFDQKEKKFLSQNFVNNDLTDLENIYMATVTGLRDYVLKNRFPGVILGLSGGIDSAFCAAVAVDALGEDKVEGFMLPSIYTSQNSFDDAEECAKRLNICLEKISIEKTYLSLEESLEKPLKIHHLTLQKKIFNQELEEQF